MQPILHIREKAHEVCDGVRVRIQLHVFVLVLEGHLPVELAERDGVLWASASYCVAGVGTRWTFDG